MSKATILIVEDEEIVADDLASKLRRLNYEISGSTARAEEAITLAWQLRPDLVLMDIRLKGHMDRVEAAEIIRRECDLPVIYLTAHSDDVTLQRAKLTEPFGLVIFSNPSRRSNWQRTSKRRSTSTLPSASRGKTRPV